MGLLRRRKPSPVRFEPDVDPGFEVPPGMVAVPADQIARWVEQQVDEASEMAVTHPLPPAIDLCAKTALPAVCGERADGFPGATQLLGYNLFLHGYWGRAVEMRALGHNDASAELTRQLVAAHEQGLGGEEWFGTLQGVSYGLAGWDEEAPELIAEVRASLQEDAGPDFHQHVAVTACAAVRDGIDAQHPGASEPLSGPEMRMCWEVGYWMRAVSLSLPDEAQAEFNSHS